MPKIARNNHDHTNPTHYYLLTQGNYKPASGQLHNNTVNGAVSITTNRVIQPKIQIW